MKQPDACVVRITNAQGETQGTGFLVSADGLVVTCVHVVEGTEPGVAFPGGEARPAQVVATDKVHDVAILQLQGELPDEAEPVRLGRSSGAYDRGFLSRGYRPLGGLEGIPAKGEMLNAVSEAPGYPSVRYMPLVLQTQHVRGGMSGAPVYVPDLDLAVGMITSYWDSLAYWKEVEERGETGTPFADRDTALATPAEAIVALCPDIRLWEPPPEFSRPPLRVPFQAPAVPRYFVPRPEVSNDLKALLLADEAAAPGALVVSAVHGLGGIGKTTLVAALAHDPDLQARFPDGVLWTTLGHQPEVLSLLVGWIQALHDYDFRPTVVESASNHLRTLLHDKACLLVVDDAWQADHVRSFLVGGDRCRVLVTTRDATLARKVGARLYDLDVMTEAQALALFEARLGPLDGYCDQVAALARELGYLPLALELAAAQVEAGISWLELLDTFRQELADLAALDLDEATYRNESLRISFRLSLESLSPDDQDAFAWLGVLPEDARLNPAMAATLWDQPKAEAGKRLHRLWDKALLKSVGNDQYAVHDLLHDEAKLRLVERMTLSEAHAALLERYRMLTPDGLWHTLPDDGHIYAYLSWHLAQAGWWEELHTLVATGDQRQEWAEARRANEGSYAGYLSDLGLAWAHADDVGQSDPAAVGRQVRYALIEGSIHSLAGNIPSELLVALVEHEVWMPQVGLTYAQQIPDAGQRFEALAGLARARNLSEPEREQAWRGALAAVRVLPETDYPLDPPRVKALLSLVPHLPGSLLQETLIGAREMRIKGHYVQALASLAPRLPREQRAVVLKEALTAARGIRGLDDRVHALAMLAPHLVSDLLAYALTVAREIGVQIYRVEALSSLACYLPMEQRNVVLDEALATVREIRDADEQVKALTILVPNLPSELLTGVLAVAQGIQDTSRRAEALAALVPYLPTEQCLTTLNEASKLARQVNTDPPHDRVWRKIVVAMTHVGNSDHALAAARQVWHDRHLPLLELIPHLTPEQRCAVLPEMLAAIQKIWGDRERARAFISLIPYLSEEQRFTVLAEVLTVPRTMESYSKDSARAWTDLMPYLPEKQRTALLAEALAAVQKALRKEDMVYALAALAPYLPSELLPEALAVARGIKAESYRVHAQAVLAQYLPEAQRITVLAEALTATQRIRDEENCSAILAELSPWVIALDRPKKALATARTIKDEFTRAFALVGLASYLPVELLPDALTAAQEIKDNDSRAKALVGLAPSLPQDLLLKALASARELSTAGLFKPFVLALRGLAPHLSLQQRSCVLTEALVAAHHLWKKPVLQLSYFQLPYLIDEDTAHEALATAAGWDETAAKALMVMAPFLEDTSLREALVVARDISDDRYRAYALAGLAPYLPELQREVLAAMQTIPLEIVNESQILQWEQEQLSEILGDLGAVLFTPNTPIVISRVQALAGLVPFLPGDLIEEALKIALAMGGENGAYALAAIAPYLSPDLLVKALVAVQQVQADEAWPWAALYLARWARTQPSPFYSAWCEVLHSLSICPRPGFLSNLRAILPCTLTFGPTAVMEISHAIQDVGRWWP